MLTGKRAHSVRGIRARNPFHTQGSELELQDLRRFRPTAQQTWRRDWPERRSRDCDVTSSNENSLKNLIHYGDRECIPLRPLNYVVDNADLLSSFASRIHFVICFSNSLRHLLLEFTSATLDMYEAITKLPTNATSEGSLPLNNS